MILKAIVAVMLFSSIAMMSFDPIVLQAEKATLIDVMPATTRAAFEGAGYVTGFSNKAGLIRFNFDTPQAGVYDLSIRYASASKGYGMTVNGAGYDGFFPDSANAWRTYDAGKIELADGANQIELGKGWGFYDIDSLRLKPSTPYPTPKAISPKLSTTMPSAEATALMTRLVSSYGHSTLSGLISQEDVDYVHGLTGATPAIMGGDLIDYTPSRRAHGSDPKKETERLIAAYHAGQIITVGWHWNAPTGLIDKKQHVDANGNTVDASWYRGFYSNATTFDFAAALDHPESSEYKLLLRDIDTIAIELRKLKAAHVPVLWRPLHESDGKWFWWGTRGPDHFKQLWRLLYERLTIHHKLDNLIWVYTWNDPAWYPGDDVVDVVGIDAYPEKTNDRLSAKWSEVLHVFDGRKLIALSEFGGVPDVEGMRRLGVDFCYFCSWSGDVGPKKNSPEDLVRIFKSDAVTNLHK